MYQSVSKFSQLTGLPKDYVQKLCRSKDFPCLQKLEGGKYYIDVDEALKYLKKMNNFRDYITTAAHSRKVS